MSDELTDEPARSEVCDPDMATGALEPRTALGKCLRLDPGVHDAAVVDNGANGMIAVVVADERYLDEVLGRGTAQAAAIAKWQKTYDLNQSTQAAISAPAGFNTLGWDSTYTRQPLPIEDMREWIQTSVESILELRPKNLYEIGCGTGLLLTRIAPHCDRYVAVDFSHAVLQRLREQLATVPSTAERVHLMERRADNFEGLEVESFDTVVINSAAQYFPNLGYLTRVLENAVGIVRNGGQVFIGDVRSLPLLPAFAASVELFQAQDDVSLHELRERTGKRMRLTPELVLSPAYFLALRQRFPRLGHVEIRLRPGRADNEMTRYRYNAILHVGPGQEPSRDLDFQDWTEDKLSIDRIGSMIRSGGAFGISGIPNARIEKDILARQSLAADDPSLTAAGLRRSTELTDISGIDPQDLLERGRIAGFQVLLSWAASRSDGSFDAAFLPDASAGQPDTAAILWPQPEPSAFLHLANAPGQSKFRAELVERLLTRCREVLSSSCLPRQIILVDSIPDSFDDTLPGTWLPEFPTG